MVPERERSTGTGDDPASSDAPSDRLRERGGGGRLGLWLLLEADRWLVTALVLAVVFVTVLVAGLALPTAEASIRSSDSIDTLFQGLLTATITGVTLVVTLNQVVLSQELGPVGDQRDRMDGAMAFREDVAAVVDAPVSPARPAEFLRALVSVCGERARDLREATSVDGTANSVAPADARSALEDLTDSVIDNADQVADGLEDARFGAFDVLSAALNFNYSWKIFTARRVHERYGDELSAEQTDALEDLIEALERFGPAREHFKTLYFQWDLVSLSRSILVAALPALLVSVCMVAWFDPSATVVGGVDVLLPAVALATAVSIAPFAILLSYVLRIATIAQFTLSIGPFILRETEAVEDVDWGE
jgi:hypothetical protein